MPEGVNSADSVRVNTGAGTPPPSVAPQEQPEEQMFDFTPSSALELGYQVAREALEAAAGPAYHLLSEMSDADKSSIAEKAKNIVPQKVKDAIHNSANNIRETRENRGWFAAFTYGAIQQTIVLIDEFLNS